MGNGRAGLCARCFFTGLFISLAAKGALAQTLPAYFVEGESGAVVQGTVGSSWYAPGFATLACPQSSPVGSCRGRAAFKHFGFLEVRPIPWKGFARLQGFVKWNYFGFGSTGFDREVGAMVRLPAGFTVGASQHRFHTLDAVAPGGRDGPGGGLWAGAFVEKELRQNARARLRDVFIGLTLFPPHNELDPKACKTEAAPSDGKPCYGFARYRIYGGAKFFFTRRRQFFFDVDGYGLLGSNIPGALYTWSAAPIGTGGRVGAGIAHHRLSIGLYQGIYIPLGKYANSGLARIFSTHGPSGGDATEVSMQWSWGFSPHRRIFARAESK